MCGCSILEELRKVPVDSGEYAARSRVAATLQARWGCPRAKHTPPVELPPDLAEEARYYGETVGMIDPPAPGEPAPPLPQALHTCPFAAVPPLHVRELLRFSRVSHAYKGAVTFAEVLGRVPSAWDIAGLDALTIAQGEVMESDMAIRESERKKIEPPTVPHQDPNGPR